MTQVLAFTLLLAEGNAGEVKLEKWDGLPPGVSVLELKESGIAKRLPDSSTSVANLDFGPITENNCGVRLSAHLTAPATGTYYFFVAGDNNVELSLSTDETSFNKRVIAKHFGATSVHQWDKYPSQRSEAVSLVEGQKYYIEALMQQTSSDGHLSVGWTIADQTVDLTEAAVGTPVTQSWTPLESGYSVSVDGGVINGSSDRFGFLNRTWTGDGEFILRVSELNDPDIWAMAGLMLRADLTPGSPHAMIVRSSDKGMLFRRRTVANGGSFNIGTPDAVEWVKLVRQGDAVRASISSNGEQWVQIGNVSMPGLPETLYIGIVATDFSGSGTIPVEATVSDFEIKPLVATEIIPTEVFELPVFVNDADLDGLPDDWEIANGLDPTTGLSGQGQYGDPDGDGINNFDEYLLGSDPLAVDVLLNGLTAERWWDINGNSVNHLTSNKARFLRLSNERFHADNLYLQNVGDNFGIRYRGVITVPADGEYRFWISGNHEAELWLADGSVVAEYGGQLTPLTNRFGKRKIAWIKDDLYNQNYTNVDDFDKFSSQQSGNIQLQAGTDYYIEILHKEQTGLDHMTLAWQASGGPRVNIPMDAFASYVPLLDDLDDDNLPDWWEAANGLNLADNGLIDPNDGERGDKDGDGLTNLEEFQAGTNPLSSDTDGDGLSDAEEIYYYRTDPTTSDVIQPVLQTQFDLTQHTATSTSWQVTPEGHLVSVEQRGWIEYTFAVAEGEEGVYEIQVTGGSAGIYRTKEIYPLSIHLNGAELGKRDLQSWNAAASTCKVLTPWLNAGTYVVRVNNENFRDNLLFRLEDISVFRMGGTDVDMDGIPDWVTGLIADDNQSIEFPTESYVSPVTVEGKTSLFNTLSVSRQVQGSETVENIEAYQGIDDRFFSHVALNPSEDTNVDIAFQNGAVEESQDITWLTKNILDGSGLVIRKGDSLKLAAWGLGSEPAGTFTLKVDGIDVPDATGAFIHQASQPLVRAFEEPGIRTVEAVWTPGDGSPSQTSSIQVDVREVDFGPALAVMAYNRRIWSIDGLSGYSVEADKEILWNEVSEVSDQTRQFSVNAYEAGKRFVVARIPETGVIIARGEINVFRLAYEDETREAKLVSVSPDGTRRYRIGIIADGLPSGVSLSLRTVTQGAAFENGSNTLVLTAADFDENGMAEYFIETDSDNKSKLCHNISVLVTQ